jgi:uncharacterized HAD superfamily protein
LIVGVDLDGVISKAGLYNPSLRLPWWLFLFLIPLISFVAPNKKTLDELRRLRRNGDKIIIISARPTQVTNLTRSWLEFHQVPFSKLFCVGFGKGTKQRKLDIIRKEGVQLFIDNDKKLLAFLNQNSVRAIKQLK